LQENGIAEDAAAATEIAGEWNCREKGIAEDATEENGIYRRMELRMYEQIHEQRIKVQENGIANV
jgi:hypothetical protein